MTLRQFITAYRKAVHTDDRVALTEYGENGEIRLHTEGDHGAYCPITAVCWAEGRGDYDGSGFGGAAGALGLRGRLADAIMSAADHHEKDLERATLRAVRRALLATDVQMGTPGHKREVPGTRIVRHHTPVSGGQPE